MHVLGEFDCPVVIGKPGKPHCFHNINMSNLLVTWCFNKTAWMKGVIFNDLITGLNKRMKSQGCNILLLLDNTPSHPKRPTVVKCKSCLLASQHNVSSATVRRGYHECHQSK